MVGSDQLLERNSLPDDEALEQVAQRNCGCPVSESVHGWVGWVSEQPGLVEAENKEQCNAMQSRLFLNNSEEGRKSVQEWHICAWDPEGKIHKQKAAAIFQRDTDVLTLSYKTTLTRRKGRSYHLSSKDFSFKHEESQKQSTKVIDGTKYLQTKIR